MYRINFSDTARKDLKKLADNQQIRRKLEHLLEEIRQHPRQGTGQVEPLRHYTTETWSRRLDKKNRMIYSIDEENRSITVLALMGHYDDR